MIKFILFILAILGIVWVVNNYDKIEAEGFKNVVTQSELVTGAKEFYNGPETKTVTD